ncbi:MAG: hypothetical protein ACKO44_04555 [Algoriphagus sp.]
MYLLPFRSETLVSALSKEAIQSKLARVTHYALEKSNKGDNAYRLGSQMLFNGQVGDGTFRISRILRKGDTFLPLISGRVEATPRGSLIFLRYGMFPSARLFLLFWTFLLLALAVAYGMGLQQVGKGLVCFALSGLNYGLALFFFHRQVRRSRELFLEVIHFQEKDLDYSL